MSDSRAGLNLVWLQAAGCGGCTLSWLTSDARDLFGMLRGAGIRLRWHPALSPECGASSLEILARCADGRERLDLLAVEGAVLRGPNGTGKFHLASGTGEPMAALVRRLAERARVTLAIGTCAAFGGMPSSGANVTEACGLQYEAEACGGLLGAAYRSRAGLPVINVAGCPPHPGWVVDTLLALAEGGLRAGDLDAYARPRFYADHLVHHACSRNEYYEFKAAARRHSELGCLMENLGCMGTQAHADCNMRPWNGTGSCPRGGFACINCTAPGFEDPGHPFTTTPKVAGIPIGLPTDMPKAWFVALSALSKSATPRRVRENASSDHRVVPPASRRGERR
jgi:ferredoxin hydrogenase small subunit